MWFVYILKCKDGIYYTGVTSDIERRLNQHVQGRGGKTTSDRKVKELVYSEVYEHKLTAIERERQIKGWRRQKKEQLIKGVWKSIQD